MILRSSLAARLLVAFGVVALVSTISIGLWVRIAIRKTEDERFMERVERTRSALQLELQAQQDAIQDMLHPLCAHDAFVDKTWIDLEARRLTPQRRLAIQQVVREETKALRLDELVLLREDGTVLGVGKHLEWIGTKREDLARLVGQDDKEFQTIRSKGIAGKEPALLGRCLTRRGRPRIGLVGERRLQPLLDRLAATYGVRVALVGGPGDRPRPDEVSSKFRIGGTSAMQFVVFQSRKRLEQALARLDRILLMTAGATLAGALVLALFLARSLSRPLDRLASQVREAASHTPRQVDVAGTIEVRTVAEAFNSTMTELAKMQKRQAAVERIAAWREVARRVAHEIKNPLTPIRTSIETLRRLKLRDDPQFDSYFDEATRAMLEEVHRIAEIASGFSRFARLPQPKLAPVDLAEVARNVVAMNQGSEVTVRLVAPEAVKVQADRDQMAQVMTNLVHNAMDAARQAHADDDAGLVELRVSQTSPDWVVLEVHDNGPGVEPELLDRIFQPYVTTKSHGSGLGLPIVQRIVVEHGGEVSVSSSERLGGALFTVRVPVEPDNSPVSSNYTSQRDGLTS